jgi:NADP-dependent 3-hydroxy acid dehydrogenase YdfG
MSANSEGLGSAVALVTGGVSGIGAAIAAALRDRGATVVAVDRYAKAESAPGEASRELAADVRDYEAMAAISAKVNEEFGHLDIVIANAAITDWGLMSTGDPRRWHDVIDTNVLGVAHTIRAALPILIAQGHGHVVITASISGRTTYVGEPIYIASKWALVGLGGALRKEVGDSGVRVSLIEPGIVNTPLVRDTVEGAAELASRQSLNPEDVARAVMFVLEQPAHVNIDELMISPLAQGLEP